MRVGENRAAFNHGFLTFRVGVRSGMIPAFLHSFDSWKREIVTMAITLAVVGPASNDLDRDLACRRVHAEHADTR